MTNKITHSYAIKSCPGQNRHCSPLLHNGTHVSYLWSGSCIDREAGADKTRTNRQAGRNFFSYHSDEINKSPMGKGKILPPREIPFSQLLLFPLTNFSTQRHRHTRTRAIKEVLPSITRQHTTITATFGTRYACFLSERQAGTNELRKPNDVEQSDEV